MASSSSTTAGRLTTDMLTDTDHELMDAAMKQQHRRGSDASESDSKRGGGASDAADRTDADSSKTHRPTNSDTDPASAAVGNDSSATSAPQKTPSAPSESAPTPKKRKRISLPSTTASEAKGRASLWLPSSTRVLFSDAISVAIPIDVTADMRVPLERQRIKRIKRIYKRFPVLYQEHLKALAEAKAKAEEENNPSSGKSGAKQAVDAGAGDMLVDDENDENDNTANTKHSAAKPAPSANTTAKPKKKPVIPNVPQPHQYGSVIDYLEAKYTRGVMLNDDEDGIGEAFESENPIDDSSTRRANDSNADDGDGSVYSQSSFLDDTDLQRTVAEQVMANATLTKVELEHGDGDFFVNVGNLEVDNDEYVQDDYDPLKDQADDIKQKKKKSSKKKSTSSAATAASSSTVGAASKGTVATKITSPASKDKRKPLPSVAGDEDSVKSLRSQTSNKSNRAAAIAASKISSSKANNKAKDNNDQGDGGDGTEDMDDTARQLRGEVDKARVKREEMKKVVVKEIQKLDELQLPRFKMKLKVSLICPPGKKPGDDVTFSNPHNPGQKLRVKVPKDCTPGTSFKVTVPAKRPTHTSTTTDHNKFPREFQELLDDYARSYDDWCNAVGAYDKNFGIYKEKQAKYVKFAKLFPKNLLTPIDDVYMKKLIRRVRQNRHKRIKAAAVRKEDGDDTTSATDHGDTAPDAVKSDVVGPVKAPVQRPDSSSPLAPTRPSSSSTKKASRNEVKENPLRFPAAGFTFPAVRFSDGDFVASQPKQLQPDEAAMTTTEQKKPNDGAIPELEPAEKTSAPSKKEDTDGDKERKQRPSLMFPAAGHTFSIRKFAESDFVV